MKNLISYIETHPWILYVIAIVLIFPAFFINLGLMPLMSDGAFRGLIAFEMILQDQYIAPTINGEFYYNKPPLFNWFIALFFRITGEYNEFTIRLPVIISILTMGLTIFLFLRKKYGIHFAAVNAFIFLTGGCMFFGYSSVGLVDFGYSWFLLLGFYAIYYYHQQKNYFLLFMLSYFFTAMAFMIKGLPALAFQAITLLVFFIYQKEFKRLFSVQHLVGIVSLLLPLSIYYFFYFKVNPDSWEIVLRILFRESSQKSVPGAESVTRFIIHFLRFPLYVTYNLLPWSLFVIFCFRKGFLKQVNAEPLLKYSFWILLFNIFIYWVSPGTDKNMRYLIMLFPMVYYITYYFYDKFKGVNVRTKNVLEGIFLGIAVIFTLTSLAAPFVKQTASLDHIWIISIGLFLVLTFLTFVYYKTRVQKIMVLIIIVIIVRIGFNLVIQPVNVAGLPELKYKNDAVNVGKIVGDEDLYLCSLISQNVTFYITQQRLRVLERVHYTNYEKNTFYIFEKKQIDAFVKEGKEFEIYYEFGCTFKNKELFLVKFR